MSYLKSLVKPVFNSELGILFRNIFKFKPVGFHFPENLNSYSCSDLFFWRTDNNFETIFRYSDLPKIYYGIENSDVLFVFYDSKGVEINRIVISMTGALSELKIDKTIVGDREKFGTFSIFHLVDNNKASSLKVINRCYVGYSRGNSISSFMHGNVEAQYINLEADDKKIMNDVAKIVYFRNQYSIQKNFSNYDYSELVFCNPASSEVWISVDTEKITLLPKSSAIVKIQKKGLVKIHSNLSMPRPMIFSYKSNYFDCHHG